MGYKKPRRENTKADPEERDKFREEAPDKQEEDATVVCIDQLRASVRQKPKAGWFPKGSTPTVELAWDRDWTMALGAITEAGDRFFSQTEASLTGEHSERFIAALCEEIEDDLVVMLDDAPYFIPNVVTDLAEAHDDLELLYFPTYSPDMNPMEFCWRQVRSRIGNRLLDSLSELHRAITNAFDEISIPDVGNYF